MRSWHGIWSRCRALIGLWLVNNGSRNSFPAGHAHLHVRIPALARRTLRLSGVGRGAQQNRCCHKAQSQRPRQRSPNCRRMRQDQRHVHSAVSMMRRDEGQSMLPNLAQRFNSTNPPSSGKFHLHPVIHSLINSGAASDPALLKLDHSAGLSVGFVSVRRVVISPGPLASMSLFCGSSLVYCCGCNYGQKADPISALNPDWQSRNLPQSQPIPRRHGDRKIADLTAP